MNRRAFLVSQPSLDGLPWHLVHISMVLNQWMTGDSLIFPQCRSKFFFCGGISQLDVSCDAEVVFLLWFRSHGLVQVWYRGDKKLKCIIHFHHNPFAESAFCLLAPLVYYFHFIRYNSNISIMYFTNTEQTLPKGNEPTIGCKIEKHLILWSWKYKINRM